MKICMLNREYNNCPYIGRDQECKTDKPCNMRQKLNDNSLPDKYVREPRWYEKYYNAKKPRKPLI